MKTLELKNVKTMINQKTLLNDISFSIEKGKILALVGHNGAGKSTLMKTIMTMLKKKSGSIVLEGFDQEKNLLAFKRNLAYLPEEPLLLPELTVMQHFQMYAISYEMDEKIFQHKLQKLVKEFELTTKLQVYPEELSKGMRQKVQTICVLLPEVPLLLIDEPFMGLDIYAIDFLLDAIKEKVKQGTSILLTTHQLDHVKELADDFILLQQGEIVEAGSIESFSSITRGYTDV